MFGHTSSRSSSNLLRSIGLMAALVVAVASPAYAGERPLRLRGTVVIAGNPMAGPAPFTVAGNGTHVGRFSGDGTVVITSSDGVVTSSGTITVVAANGDSLTFDFVATGSAQERTGPVTFVSGTGRFADAVVDATITSRSAGGEVTVTIQGTIDY